MKRWLFNIAAGVSLLMGVLVGFIWVRSELNPELISYRSTTSTDVLSVYLQSPSGAIAFGRQVSSWTTPKGRDAAIGLAGRTNQKEGWSYSTTGRSRGIPALSFEHLWFQWLTFKGTTPLGYAMSQVRLEIPDWFLILVSLVLPTIWLIRAGRARRLKFVGCCAKCGYDLRATPERCPECGTVPQGSSAHSLSS